jgi:methyl acetate hydrolase
LTNLNQILADGVAAGHMPFAVAMTGTAAGITYSGAAGTAATGRAAAENTVFRVFSMSKAICGLAAMILIERGKLSLDTAVADILPDFDSLQVLDGFDGDTPRMRAPKTKATVRHLATHTSGLEYEFWNGDVARAITATGHPGMLTGLRAALNYPMATDPGTRWGYGMSTDWLTLVVQAIDGRRIDAFCQQEIFDPLGMTQTSFEVSAGQAPHLCSVSIRGEDGAFAPFDLAPPSNPEVYGMGHALYSTAPDYMRFLRMILNKGALEGQRILKDTNALTADQMRGLQFRKMVSAVPPISADVDLHPSSRRTHGLGFLRHEDDVPGRRSAGSLSWAGVLNTHYWIDPARDIAAVFMTQALPFVDPRVMQVFDQFEAAVYAG